MIRRLSKMQNQPPWRLLLGVLCLALLVFGSTVQVAHSHPGGDLSHADCSLCATAHVVAQAVGNPIPAPAILVAAAVQDALQDPDQATHFVFALFTRPPPSVSKLA